MIQASTRPALESALTSLLREPALQAHRIQVPPKAVLYQPLDVAKNVFFLQSGQVRIHQIAPNGSRRMVEILGPQQWCGSAALARLDVYGEVAEAVTPSTLAIVSVERLFEVLAHHPRASVELIRGLATKLASYREDAGGLVFEDCNHRLVRTLMHLSSSPAASTTADGVILHITHQQLAQKVGVARETISVALGQLRRRNVLRTGRNQLIFRPQSLLALDLNQPEPSSGDDQKTPANAGRSSRFHPLPTLGILPAPPAGGRYCLRDCLIQGDGWNGTARGYPAYC